MSKKSKIILLLLIIVIIIFGLIYFFIYREALPTGLFNRGEGNEKISPEVPGLVEREKQALVRDPEAEEKIQLVQLASFFTARFGSYSNQNNYENIEELKPQMTAQMKIWANGFIQQEKTKHQPSESYWGITTKVVSAELKSVDLEQGKAEAVISTQCQETTDKEQNVYYQEATLQLIKESGIWKIDELAWKKK